MTDLTYNLNREEAALLLWISTRTLDRHIRNWKLSYKKVANRIFLDENELRSMEDQFNQVVEKQESQVIGNFDKQIIDPQTAQTITEFDNKILDKLDEIAQWLVEKDKQLSEKNAIINILQQRVVELEFKVQHSIALPDYSVEKEQFLIDKEKSEIEKKTLKDDLAKEKLINMTVILLIILVILLYVFL